MLKGTAWKPRDCNAWMPTVPWFTVPRVAALWFAVLWLALPLSVLLTLSACEDDDVENVYIEIAGRYEDDEERTHRITETGWVINPDAEIPETFTFYSIDNSRDYVIAQNSELNLSNPGKYSRFEWTYIIDQIYVCQSVFNADSPADAEAVPEAEDRLPATGGCEGPYTPWLTMRPLEE